MDQFLGEIRLFSFAVIPRGWVACEGQLLPITQYSALFALLGTQFGGNGTSNFALPDLRGRVALGAATPAGSLRPGLTSQAQGAKGGTEGVTLPKEALAEHTHSVYVGTTFGNTSGNAQGGFPAVSVSTSPTGPQPLKPVYVAPTANTKVALNPQTVAPTPAQQVPLPNLQPSTCMRFCISLVGVFPSRP